MGENRLVTITAGIILVFLCGLMLRWAEAVFVPFFLAILFYFVLSPLLDFLRRLKIPRLAAVSMIITIAFCLLYFLGALVYSSGRGFATSLPQYGEKLSLLAVLAAVFELGGLFPTLWIFILILVLDSILANIFEPKWLGAGLGLSPSSSSFPFFSGPGCGAFPAWCWPSF